MGTGASQRYDPAKVEYAPLDAPYFHYLVSCATHAQAIGIKAPLRARRPCEHPNDPRQVVFTVLPGPRGGHREKWVPGKAPFQTIWEYTDQGALQVANRIPQGPMRYEPNAEGLMVLSPDPVAELLEAGACG